MNLARYKALSFDCYGTLIDWETGILDVLRPWAESVGLDPTMTSCYPRTPHRDGVEQTTHRALSPHPGRILPPG
jgi:FMN phosphatase YigB (HAD superfamily)